MSTGAPHTPVRIAPTTPEDLPEVVACEMLAFSGAFPPFENFGCLLNPFRAPLVRAGVHPRRWPDFDSVLRYSAREMRKGVMYFTAFAPDDDGVVRPAGLAVLEEPLTVAKAARASKAWTERLLGDYVHPSVDAVQDRWWQDEVTGVDPVFMGVLFGAMEKGRNEFRLERDCYILRTLVVQPHMQRRGVGSALLRHCFALTDAANTPIYLEASQVGAPLYASLGFRTIRTLRIEYKGEVVEAPVMVREPGGVDVDEGTAGSRDEESEYFDVGLRARE
ncbi:hypothetical protein M0805_003158 [Coniferiporia weirii]|nr:hypothetical protein M0805_003158 [Coniferiporia weirii]